MHLLTLAIWIIIMQIFGVIEHIDDCKIQLNKIKGIFNVYND